MARTDVRRLSVVVVPRAGRDEVTLAADGTVRVRVTAPPERGKANERVECVLAARLGISPRRVRVVRGFRSRSKTVEIEGLSADPLELIRCSGVGGGG